MFVWLNASVLYLMSEIIAGCLKRLDRFITSTYGRKKNCQILFKLWRAFKKGYKLSQKEHQFSKQGPTHWYISVGYLNGCISSICLRKNRLEAKYTGFIAVFMMLIDLPKLKNFMLDSVILNICMRSVKYTDIFSKPNLWCIWCYRLLGMWLVQQTS